MGFLSQAFDVLQSGLSNLSGTDALIVDNVLSGQSFFRKTGYDRVLDDMHYCMTILGDGDAGFSYHNTPILQDILTIVNKYAPDVVGQVQHLPLKVSLIDAIASVYNRVNGIRPTESYAVNGSYQKNLSSYFLFRKKKQKIGGS
jgi:hypothetical protein